MYLTDVTGATPVSRVRGEIAKAMSNGDATTCPCCKKTVKEYQRRVHRSMLAALHELDKAGELTSADILRRRKVRGGRDSAMLAYWGLATLQRNGLWKITHAGKEFLKGRRSIPKYAYVYNGSVTAFSEERIKVSDIA